MATSVTKDEGDSSEEDYMSDAILAQCADVRPSLLHQQGEKRKHEILKKQKEDNATHKRLCRPIRVVEAEGREAGLQKQIGLENKGFQMLSKMGYKPGSGLGKSGQNDAIVEPIPVEFKSDRLGIGQKSKQRETLKALKERRAETEHLNDPETFRMRVQAAANAKNVERDLRNAQTACRNLELQKKRESPAVSWYWPSVEEPKKIEEDEDKDDDSDASESEPEYSNEVVEEPNSDTDTGDTEPEPDLEPEDGEKLVVLTEYIRREYFYCIWCGSVYETVEELERICPGNGKDYH